MTTPSDFQTQLTHKIKLAISLSDRAASTGLVAYHQQLTIDSRPESKRFVDAADQWQWDRVHRVRERVELLAGLTSHPQSGVVGGLSKQLDPPRAYWDVCPRGHDKSTGVGRVLSFLLAYSRKPLNMYAAAGDEEQANLLTEAMQAEVNLNPWLAQHLTFVRNTVTGPGGRLKVLTSDAPTSWGSRPDVVVLDELTFWKKRNLFDALVTALHKRPGSMLWIIGNAGEIDTWQWELLQVAKADPYFWSVFEVPVDTTLASWLSEDDIKRITRTLPPGLARRVIGNHWVPQGEGCEYLTAGEVAPCCQIGLQTHQKAQYGTLYFIGMDYGPKKDRTVGTVLHREDGSTQVLIDRVRLWQGSPSPVPIKEVAAWLREMRDLYPYCVFVMDPYQMESTIQELQAEGATVVRFEPRGGKSNYEMAEALRDHIINRRIAWAAGTGDLIVPGPSGMPAKIETMADELSRLIIKPTAYGYRFDHTLQFHDDRACSIGMALVRCIEEPIYPSHSVGSKLDVPARPPMGVDRVLDHPRGKFRGLFGIN